LFGFLREEMSRQEFIRETAAIVGYQLSNQIKRNNAGKAHFHAHVLHCYEKMLQAAGSSIGEDAADVCTQMVKAFKLRDPNDPSKCTCCNVPCVCGKQLSIRNVRASNFGGVGGWIVRALEFAPEKETNDRFARACTTVKRRVLAETQDDF
jgi:hypothetical protein